MKPKALITMILLRTLMAAIPATAMDMARVENRTDLAVTNYGVSGQGVIVALLDRGIDWKNDDFRHEDGTTRIKYIFDLTDNTGAGDPGNTYGRGTIYTEAQINVALAGGPTLATRDAVGHGTTTAGIATGNGRNLLSRKYRGVAPNATIIVVKVTSEGAPAHDGEPAEPPFNDPTAYPVAIDFVRDKSVELGKPAVMLLNLGSIIGPTDGSSSLAQKIDDTVGPGHAGLVFVNGTGDDGGMPNHAGGIVAQGGKASIQIQKGATGTLLFDLWYGGKDRLDVSLQTPSGDFGPYTSPPTNNDQSFVTNPTFTYHHQGSNLDFFGANNDKREIFIEITGPVGTYTVQLQGATVASGRFDATINPSNIEQPPAQSNRFLSFVVPGSIWDGATAHNNICPNDYVIRTDWTDVDGKPRSISNLGQGNIGELWLGSSVGPTFDNRLGVDVSAPGDSVFTTYNPRSYWATFRFNLIQDGNGFYGRASAVSAASPQVTGIIALMLQRNPNLDATQIKMMLQQSARTDSFTGKTPNPNWGYGKVDANAAVALAVQSAPPSSLANISTRLRVEAGDNVLIGGFIVAGTQPKKVIVRAIGPSLPVSDALTDPILELRDSSGELIRSNDNWRSDQETEIIATGIPPSNDAESAIVETLPANGAAYTAIVRGANNGTGVGLVEVYDLDRTVDSKLANISTRGLVQTGDNAMIAGTIVLGQGSQRALVRAIGPSLPIEGKLADPALELRDGNGTLIHANDNWRSDQEAEIIATTIPPTNDLESAIVEALPANGAAYTAIVRGVNDTTGVALVEVYSLTD
jgi:minor extracellular serine protease Vpr